MFGIPCLNRHLPNVGQADTRIANIAIVVQRNVSCHTSNSIISHLALQFEICATTSLYGSRYTNLREQLIMVKCCLERHISEELFDGQNSLTGGTNSYDTRPHSQHRRGMIVGGISVSNISANCGPVTHHRVCNHSR